MFVFYFWSGTSIFLHWTWSSLHHIWIGLASGRNVRFSLKFLLRWFQIYATFLVQWCTMSNLLDRMLRVGFEWQRSCLRLRNSACTGLCFIWYGRGDSSHPLNRLWMADITVVITLRWQWSWWFIHISIVIFILWSGFKYFIHSFLSWYSVPHLQVENFGFTDVFGTILVSALMCSWGTVQTLHLPTTLIRSVARSSTHSTRFIGISTVFWNVSKF